MAVAKFEDYGYNIEVETVHCVMCSDVAFPKAPLSGELSEKILKNAFLTEGYTTLPDKTPLRQKS